MSINQLLKIELSREIGCGSPCAVPDAPAKGQRSCVTTNVDVFNICFGLRMHKQVVRAHKSLSTCCLAWVSKIKQLARGEKSTTTKRFFRSGIRTQQPTAASQPLGTVIGGLGGLTSQLGPWDSSSHAQRVGARRKKKHAAKRTNNFPRFLLFSAILKVLQLSIGKSFLGVSDLVGSAFTCFPQLKKSFMKNLQEFYF